MASGQLNKAQCGEFGRLLSGYISESGYTVYKVSQMAGVGRSAIQHTMSGKLLPKKDFVEKLCAVLPLTPAQQDELMEMYVKDKIGEDRYTGRKIIERIIENFSQYNHESSVSCYRLERDEAPAEGVMPGAGEISTVTGLINVNNMLKCMLLREISCGESGGIITTVPFENEVFFSTLMTIPPNEEKKTVFEHYIRLYKSENSGRVNLEVLENVIKTVMDPGIDYRPFYHYSFAVPEDDIIPVFPYFLIAGGSAALISSDFKSAMCASDAGFISLVMRKASAIKSHSLSMLSLLDEQGMVQMVLQQSMMFQASVEHQPCLTEFLPMQMIERYLPDLPIRDWIIDSVASVFFAESDTAYVNRINHSSMCYYTKEGLDIFADTGKMLSIPGYILDPLDEDDRVCVLCGLRTQVESDRFLILKRERLFLLPSMQVILLQNKSVIINCVTENLNMTAMLTESLICSAFEDWIESFAGSRGVCSKEETIAAIDDCIERIKKRRGEGS